jgi:hypothetical protein
VIARCPDLSRARGLGTVELLSGSSIDLATLRHGLENLPDELLGGMGLEGEQIAALRSASARAGR